MSTQKLSRENSFRKPLPPSIKKRTPNQTINSPSSFVRDALPVRSSELPRRRARRAAATTTFTRHLRQPTRRRDARLLVYSRQQRRERLEEVADRGRGVGLVVSGLRAWALEGTGLLVLWVRMEF